MYTEFNDFFNEFTSTLFYLYSLPIVKTLFLFILFSFSFSFLIRVLRLYLSGYDILPLKLPKKSESGVEYDFEDDSDDYDSSACVDELSIFDDNDV